MRMKKKKFFGIMYGIVLVMGIVLGLSPTSVLANNPGNAYSGTNIKDVTLTRKDWSFCGDYIYYDRYYYLTTGIYYIDEDVTLDRPLMVAQGNTVTLNLNGNTLTGNSGDSVVVVAGGKLTVNDGKITGGRGNGEIRHGGYSRGGGFAVDFYSDVTLNDVVITGNSANFGGGIFIHGPGDYSGDPAYVTLNRCTITGNSAEGAGVFFDGGNLTLNDSIISDNSGWGLKVGAKCDGVFLKGNSIIYGNTDGDIYIGGIVGAYGSLQGVSVIGELGANARIGINMQNPNIFTNSENTSYNDPSKFISNSGDWISVKNTDGQLMLVAKSKVKINTTDFTGPYDGNEHTINYTMEDGEEAASLKFGTVEGTYNLTEPPKFINYGIHPVYYQINIETTGGTYVPIVGAASVNIQPIVSFDHGEGSGSMDSVNVDAGSLYKLPESTFTEPENAVGEFGWRSNKDAKIYAPGTQVTVSENTTFTAEWVTGKVASFVANGGSGDGPENIVKIEGSVIRMPKNTFNAPDAGRFFSGWSADNGETLLYPGDKYTLNNDVTFKAQWDTDKTASFDANGGSGNAPEEITTSPSELITLPENTFIPPANKIFGGWSDGNNIYDVGAGYILSNDTTFKAQWIDAAKVTFDSNGGSVVEPQYVAMNSCAVAPTPTRPGYSFLYWTKDGSKFDFSTKINENVTLTALWIQGTSILEGGENGLPDGWTTSGDYQWSVGVGDYDDSTGTHSGDKNFKAVKDGSGGSAWLILPQMDLSEVNSASLNMWYINRSWGGDIDEFGVYYRVNNGDWKEIYTTTGSHNTWTELTNSLPDGALSANVEIGFRATSNYGYGIGLDDISVVATAAHTHSWRYTAATSSILASCSGVTEGTCFEDSNSLTIEAPTMTQYGQTGAGVSASATLDGLENFNTLTGLNISVDSIKYYRATKDNQNVYTKGDEITTGAPTGAGDYIAEIELTNVKTNTSESGTVTASVGYTISKATPTANEPTATAIYGQTLADVSITNPEGNTTGEWSWVDNATTSVGNVGSNTFKANFTPTDTDNYSSVSNLDVTITVAKADKIAPAAPTKASATINSITLTAITNGEYRIGEGQWQDSPEFTGLTMNTEYTFYQRLKGDNNHNDSPASQSATFSTNNHAHDWVYDADGATITATCGNTDGGHDTTELTTTLTVVKPTLTQYGQTGVGISASATLTGLDDFNSATGKTIASTDIRYVGRGTTTYDESDNPPTDAGTYTAKITVEGKTALIDYEIAKASSSVSNPPTAKTNLVYNGSSKNLLNNDGEASNGSLYYALGTNESTAPTSGWDTSIPAQTNAGTYYVWYKVVVENSNYADTVPVCIPVTISKAPGSISYETSTVDKTMIDAAFTNELTNTGDGAVTYSSNKENVATVNASTGEVTIVGVGTATVTATVVDGNNYTYTTKTTSYSLSITKKESTITAPTAAAITYGQTLADSTLTGGMAKVGETVVEGSFAWETDTIVPEFSDSNTTEYNVLFTPTDDTKYETMTCKVKLTVNKANPEYTIPTNLQATYGQTLNDVSFPNAENGTWSWLNSDTSVGNVGTNQFTAVFTPTDTNNYNTLDSITVTVAVNRKVVTVANGITASDKDYDGTTTATISTANAVFDGILEGDTLTVSAVAAFEDADAGKEKTVAISGYTLGGTNVANYELSTTGNQTSATADINRRNVTLTSATASKTYDGTALTDGTVIVSGDGFATGEGATYNVTGTQTLPGESDNTFTYTLNSGTLANNYTITTTEGKLTVTNRTVTEGDDKKYEITVTAHSGEVTYDGTEHSVSGFTETQFAFNGVTYTVSGLTATAKGTDAGTYTATVTGTAVVKDSKGNVLTDQFIVNTTNGTLTINKRNVTLTSATNSKTYDGTAFTDDTVTVSGDGFVTGEGATYNVTGSQKVVGSSSNAFTYTLNSGTKVANYNITTVPGTLTVTNRDSKYQISPQACSDTVKYDGQNHEVTGFVTDTFTVDGNTYTVSGLTATGTGTDAGSHTVSVSGTAVVKDSDKTDVTDQFTVTPQAGTLTINKRNVTLTSATDTKEYDGDALTNDTVKVSGDKFVTGEGATYDVTGTRTLVGSSENTFTYTLKDNTKAGNYNITQNNGTLTVNNRNAKYTVALESNSGIEKYDGTSKTVSGYTIDGNAGEAGDEGVVTSFKASNGKTYTITGMSAEVTEKDAGEYAVNVIGTPLIKDSAGNDVTAQFAVSGESGKLTINKRNVTLTSATNSKTYDGTALTDDTVTSSGDGFVTGEGATFDVTGSQTLAGESDNAFTYTLNEGTKAANYNITTNNGTLTVTKSESSVTVSAVTGLVYDGTAKALVTVDGLVGGTVMYRIGTDGEWQDKIPEGTDTGTYNIYYYIKADDNHNDDGSKEKPKGMVETVIKEASGDAPAEIDVVNVSEEGGDDGQITGVNETMEYSVDGGETWTKVSDGKETIENLSAGEVLVRYAETDDKNYSKTTKIVIGVASKTEGVVEFKPEEGSDSVAEKAVNGVDDNSTKESVEEFAETQKEEGKDVKVALEITPQEEDDVNEISVTETSKVVEEVFAGIDSENVITEYLVIDVAKYVDNVREAENISDTKTPLEIALKYDSKKSNPVVIRTHDGKAKAFDKLKSRPEKKDFKDATFYIDTENEILYIYSQYFSDFAIVYATETTYNVGFVSGTDDELTPLVVAGDGTITLPTGLTKAGYAFGGWYKDEAFKNEWKNGDKVTDDVMLYAKWNKLVTGISVTPEIVKFTKAGETSQIKVTLTPKDAVNTNVTYKSGNTKVANVDANGKITAVANGTTEIMVTTVDGAKTAKVKVTVAIPEVKPQGNLEDNETNEQTKTNDTKKEQSGTTEQQKTEQPVDEPTKEEKATIAMNAGLKISQTGSRINIHWGKVDDVDGYEVYVTYCGMKFKKPVEVLTGNANTSVKVTKINDKKINLKKNYKVYVAAYKVVDGKKVQLAKTITGHIVGRRNTAYTNVKMIKLAKSKYSIKVGKTAKIKAKTVLVDKRKKQLSNAHATQFRYASSNENIATVSKKGKIKGVSKGKCTIYVYARNGYAKKVSVTVR